jgi:hypothetical protein
MGFPHAKGYAGQLESITFGVGNCALGHFKTLVPNTVRNGHYEHKKRKRSGRRAAEKSKHWHGWLPGTRSKRPLRPFQQTIDELAPFHSIALVGASDQRWWDREA